MAPLRLLEPPALPAPLLDRIADLAPLPRLENFYLAGSSALALFLDHRDPHSLDLMSLTDRLTSPSRRDLLQELLSIDEELRVETARDGYLFTRCGDGTALRFFYYPYPQVDPEEDVAGLAVASAVDLGLMKLGAIISRGGRRDFVDLYLLAKRLPLPELLERSSEKFGHVLDFPLQALKALADLSLVEGEPMPRLRRELDWVEVEDWLHLQVRRLGREHVGLAANS